jgi:IgGFc binding protein
MSLFLRWAGAISTMLVATGVACGSEKNGFDDAPNVFQQDVGDEAASPGCGGRRCSRDLHTVVDDCTQEVIEECSSDRGCAAGACVPACDSVAASQGSIGCSFFAVPPDSAPSADSSCYAAFIANTWNTPATLEAEFGRDRLDISKSVYRAIVKDDSVSYERIEGAIPPGELAIVFLSQGDQGIDAIHHLSCPSDVEVAWRGIVAKQHATSIYKAFHLTTDVPVSAYSMFPYGGAKSFIPSATLLLPTPSWRTNYILVDGWQASAGSPFIQIVAQADGTEIRIRPQVDVRDGVGVTGAVRGAVARWTLQRGEVLELAQPESLAGSPIEASQPVAVFGGNQCALVPDGRLACDSLHQQIPPIHHWASSYSAVPYESRRKGLGGAAPAPESVYWRIVGASDGTVLTYEPEPPSGSPATLKSGETVTFTSNHPFVVKSQDAKHPFYLAVYMSGSQTYSTLGDPDFVNVVPDEQFLDRYVFFLDHTYSDSNLTVVRRKDRRGLHDVTIDCLGPVTEWLPLGNDGAAEYAWVKMTRNRGPVKTAIGSCGYGRHEALSDGPFALYVWGLDADASYGFPAGAGSRPTSPYEVPVR